MKKLISSLLKIKNVYLIITLLLFCLITDFIMYDYINTSQINDRYSAKMQTQQEAVVYNEHDDLMADFKDDLAEIALEEVKEEGTKSDYLSDVLFNVADSILPVITYCLFLAFFIFHALRLTSAFSQVKYTLLLKITLITYFIIPLKNVLASLWFGLFQTNYEKENLTTFYKSINPSIQSLFSIPENDNWYNYIFKIIDIELLLLLFLIPVFIKISEKFKFKAIAKMTLIPILVFLFIWPYLSGIILSAYFYLPEIDLSF